MVVVGFIAVGSGGSAGWEGPEVTEYIIKSNVITYLAQRELAVNRDQVERRNKEPETCSQPFRTLEAIHFLSSRCPEDVLGWNGNSFYPDSLMLLRKMTCAQR